MRLTVLGSGTSFGIPQIGCECRVCVSPDPRDRRGRVAAVVENEAGARLLIDTPPELRLQLVRERIDTVDAVLYTHDHADHMHGIDDLRAISLRRGSLSIYGPPETLERLAERFGYILDNSTVRPPGISKPDLRLMPLEPGREVTISGLAVLPVELDHGLMRVYGYRIGELAYLTDVKTFPAGTLERLQGVRVLVINALLEWSHPTHLSIDEAVVLAQRVGAKQTYLTHLTHRLTHVELAQRLPNGIEPAYDGLSVVF